MANTLITLPPEIVHNILKYVDPIDLARLSKTCKALKISISEDRLLSKEIYCRILDEPQHSSGPTGFDYEQELHDFARMRGILTGDSSVDEKVARLQFVSNVATKLLRTASPGDSKNMAFMREWFDDKRDKDKRDNIEAFLCQSTTFNRARIPYEKITPPSFSDRQASARLHVQYGIPIACPRRTKYNQAYPYAISMVYDLRNYRQETFWGPYLPDSQASVDWEKMEAVMIVLGHNLRMFTEQTHSIFGPKAIWREPWLGASPGSYEPTTLRGLESSTTTTTTAINDPYNIQGIWMRVVCFLDFHDLFAYNFTAEEDPDMTEPRPALDTNEAIRLISMEIHVTKTEDPGPEDGQELPVVYFEGISKSMHTQWDPNANSRIRGTVRMTKEGEVRWQTISVYGGEERWASEGIQVGGIRSARGVLGHWFDKDHDIHGPAGPTAFWKINDNFDDEQDNDSDEDDEDWTEDPEAVLEAIAQIVGFQ